MFRGAADYAPPAWLAERKPTISPGRAPVRLDGQCLLAAGGEPLHGVLQAGAPESLRFGATHIEPIEDET